MTASAKRVLFVVAGPILALLSAGCPQDPNSNIDLSTLLPAGGVLSDACLARQNENCPDKDTDRDGLTDAQETAGWTVWIEKYGLQLGTDTFGNIVYQYAVTSDPNNPDTDGDGLSDYLEFMSKSDPRMADSDDDGLWDGEEHHQWLTSPTHVDTDADSRGNRDLQNAPNTALFDGTELFTTDALKLKPGHPDRVLKPRATSPTLADTDGDGVSDFDEFGSTVRNNVVADLPLLNYELVGDVDVRLNVEYAETIGETREYGVTLTESQTETVASEFSNTVGWSLDVMAGFSTEIGVFSWGSFFFEVTAGVHGEYTWTNSVESSRESSKELSRVQSDSREFTETAADGEIVTAILLKNAGNTTFTLNDIGVLVSKFDKKKALGDITPPARKTIATMTPVFNSITLAPGEEAGPFKLAAEGVNAQSIKELLAAPDTFMLATAAMNFTDSSGLDLDYVREVTVARTAYLMIDFGDGEVRQYHVATNVDRNPDGTYRGITLRRVLEEALGLPYGNAARGYTTMANPAPGSNGRQVLDSLLGRRYAKVDGKTVAWWNAGASDQVRTNVGFNDIVLHAGDQVALMFQLDSDGDDLPNTIEKAAGTNVNPIRPDDADGDDLTDYIEVVKGWVVFADPADPGVQWASYGGGLGSRLGFSSQREAVRWSADQALGEPNTTQYGDHDTAWAPANRNGTLEYITVFYPTPVYASGATIRETWGNGMVYQVDVVDMGNNLHTVWTGTDPSQPGEPVDYRVNWPVTTYLVKGVKVYTDTDHDLDAYEEIDAIALHGYPDKRARRVLSDPRFADADNDGLTDRQERDGATADPLFFRSSDPLNPDTDGDGPGTSYALRARRRRAQCGIQPRRPAHRHREQPMVCVGCEAGHGESVGRRDGPGTLRLGGARKLGDQRGVQPRRRTHRHRKCGRDDESVGWSDGTGTSHPQGTRG